MNYANHKPNYNVENINTVRSTNYTNSRMYMYEQDDGVIRRKHHQLYSSFVA